MIKAFSGFAAFCWLLGVSAAATSAGAAERPVVVELFTSEGCSSCPPADALLARLAARTDVLALAFHVDYWNRLGWTDPFSSPEATARQRHYAQLLGLEGVYTPQIVVDGRWQAVGSDEAAVDDALANARRDRAPVPVTLAVDPEGARIALGASRSKAAGVVWLIGFDRRHTDAVSSGENAGRSLTHVDVVRGIAEVGRFTGDARVIEVPLDWRSDRIAAIVQASDGRILGAAVADARPAAGRR